MITHSFSLSPESVRRLLRQMLWRFQVWVTASFLLFGLYLAWFAGPFQLAAATALTGVIGLAYFGVIFFHYRQQVRLLYSVRIELDGSGIIYQDRSGDPLRISRADIKRAEVRKDGLWIETVNPRIHLLVPKGLSHDGDAVVRQVLERWTYVEPLLKPAGGRHRWLRFPIYGTAGLILLFANSLWVIVPLALGVIVYGVYVETRLMRAYEQVPGMQRMYSLSFSFLFFVILMKLCFLLLFAFQGA